MSARQVIPFVNEAEWRKHRVLDVTSTESAALFGECPRSTHFELWHRKRDGVEVEFEPNERMDWGNDLQDSIAASLGRRYGVKTARVTEYMRITASRMGASFDYEIVDSANVDTLKMPSPVLIEMFNNYGPGILEIKNVDRSVFRDKWLGEDGKTMVPPGHIDIQLQHQLHVRERAWGAIGVLVGGNTGKLIVKLRDPDVGKALEARIVKFWQSIEANEPPPPVFPDDAEFVASLYKTSVDRVFDGRGNEELEQHIRDYRAALEREKLATEDKKVAQAKALMIIGNAERAYTDGFTISAPEVGETVVPSYTRKGYRYWKITPKKGKS